MRQHEQARRAEVVTSKQLALKLGTLTAGRPKRSVYIPPADHPWRRFRTKPYDAKTRAAGGISIRQK